MLHFTLAIFVAMALVVSTFFIPFSISLQQGEYFTAFSDQFFYEDIPGYKQCGGPATLVDMSSYGCNGTSPCKLHATDKDKTRFMRVRFVSTRKIDKVGVRISYDDSPSRELKVIYDDVTTDGNISDTGREHEGMIYFTASEESKGKSGTFRIEYYDKNTDNVEVCAEAEVEIIP